MAIEKYQLADCNLFRTPAIDYSGVELLIEEKILEAYRNGGSAQSLVESIATDGSVAGQLAAQIEDSMNMQKAYAAQALAKQQQEIKTRYDAEKHRRLSAINDSLGASVAEKNEAYEAESKEASEAQIAYTRTQKSLNEMRARITVGENRLGQKTVEDIVRAANEVNKEDENKKSEGDLEAITKTDELSTSESTDSHGFGYKVMKFFFGWAGYGE